MLKPPNDCEVETKAFSNNRKQKDCIHLFQQYLKINISDFRLILLDRTAIDKPWEGHCDLFTYNLVECKQSRQASNHLNFFNP